ncbi:hypothetical protein GGX14DRAFT_604490 [Mycena pura]|uniref:Uncharacterized protein n=1 Tax=Mycena pura TaxID=153505 RepID=A0AAD6YGS4_9AGAR|nr:hypothetical protein GGX14DRAFT_604490 [Mycena pura]
MIRYTVYGGASSHSWQKPHSHSIPVHPTYDSGFGPSFRIDNAVARRVRLYHALGADEHAHGWVSGAFEPAQSPTRVENFASRGQDINVKHPEQTAKSARNQTETAAISDGRKTPIGKRLSSGVGRVGRGVAPTVNRTRQHRRVLLMIQSTSAASEKVEDMPWHYRNSLKDWEAIDQICVVKWDGRHCTTFGSISQSKREEVELSVRALKADKTISVRFKEVQSVPEEDSLARKEHWIPAVLLSPSWKVLADSKMTRHVRVCQSRGNFSHDQAKRQNWTMASQISTNTLGQCKWARIDIENSILWKRDTGRLPGFN